MLKLFLEYSVKLLQITAVLLKTMFGRNFEYQAKSDQRKTNNACNEHASSVSRWGTDIVKSMIGWAFAFLGMDILFKKVIAGDLHVDGINTSSHEKITKLSIQEHKKNVAIIENLKREIKSTCRLIDDLKIKVQFQRGDLQAKTTKLASLQVENLTKKMQFCCLQSKSDTQAMTIVDLEHKITDLEDQVASLNGVIRKKNIEVARLISEAENRSQDLQTTTSEVLSWTTDEMDQNDQFAHLKGSVERVTVGNPKIGKNVGELTFSSVKANR